MPTNKCFMLRKTSQMWTQSGMSCLLLVPWSSLIPRQAGWLLEPGGGMVLQAIPSNHHSLKGSSTNLQAQPLHFPVLSACCCCIVAKLSLTLCNPKDCRQPGPSVHGISQARILEWVAGSSSRRSFWSRDRTHCFKYQESSPVLERHETDLKTSKCFKRNCNNDKNMNFQ